MQHLNNGLFVENKKVQDILHSFDWASTPLGKLEAWPEALCEAVTATITNNLTDRPNVAAPSSTLTSGSKKAGGETVHNILLETPFALAILKGPHFVVELANAKALELWGRTREEVIDKTILQCLPELESKGFVDILTKVYTTGQEFVFEETPIKLHRSGKQEDAYINFTYQPLFDATGNVYAIICTGVEVTGQVELRRKLQLSESRFNNIINQAPVAVRITTGPDFIIDVANKAYMKIIGREDEDFTGQPLFTVLPELEGQGIRELITQVYTTSKPYYTRELGIEVIRHGKKQTMYFNLLYHPLYENEDGKVSSVMVVVEDITAQVEARHKIEENSRQFLGMVMKSPIAMAIFRGRDHNIEMANDTMLKKIWEREFDEIKNKKLLDVFPELGHQRFPALLKQVYETGIAYSEHDAFAYLKSNNGLRNFYLDFEYAPLFEKTGGVSAIMVTVVDVTDKVEAKNTIEEAETRLRLAAEAARLATFDWDLVNGNFSQSPRLAEIFGFAYTEGITHARLQQALHPDDVFLRNSAVKKGYLDGFLNYEVRIIWPDTTVHWIKVYGKTLYDVYGQPLRMYGTVQDITAEKESLTLLREGEERLRIAAEAAGLGTWELRLQPLHLYYSPKLAVIFGYEEGDVLTYAHLRAHVHPDDDQMVAKAFSKALLSGYLNYEVRIIWNDGSMHWVRSHAKTIYNETGKPVRLLGTLVDITSQKEALKELQESEERLRLATGAAALGTFDLDLVNDKLICSSRYLQLFGYDGNVVWGSDFFYSHLHPEDVDIARNEFKQSLTTGNLNYIVRAVWKDQSIHWVKKNGKVFYDSKGVAVRMIGTLMDVSERKYVEAELERKVAERTAELQKSNVELQQQKDFVDTVLDSSVDVISVFDTEGRYIAINRKFEELYNFSKDYMIGRNIKDIFSPEKTAWFRANLSKAAKGEGITGVINKSAITGKHYESFFIPLKQDGVVYAVLVVAHDNTDIFETSEKLATANYVLEQQAAHLKKANAALEKSNAQLEQYAYVASHDLQEPLRKIRIFSGMLSDRINGIADDAAKGLLQKVIDSSSRMSTLIHELLNYSRLLNPEKTFEPTDLNILFKNIISDFELTIEQKKAILHVCMLPTIEAVTLQMNQLFYNLLNNALKFTKENIPPVIAVNVTSLTVAQVAENKNLEAGLDYIDISITDNGIGFGQQYAQQIFEVFKRLHSSSEYNGSGIGLALCRRITANHYGDIYAEGKENEGCVFHVILPVKQP